MKRKSEAQNDSTDDHRPRSTNEIDAPDDLPDGTPVTIEVTPLALGKIGLTEAEWRDDEEALADWSAWLETIEPVDFRQEDDFDRSFREYNLEAVRKQMNESSGS